MTKRRHKGEGGISEYRTRSGPRFLIKYPVGLEDGTTRVVLKRGFLTKKDAAAALRSEIRKDRDRAVGASLESAARRLS
jgi:hypothetical protein